MMEAVVRPQVASILIENEEFLVGQITPLLEIEDTATDETRLQGADKAIYYLKKYF